MHHSYRLLIHIFFQIFIPLNRYRNYYLIIIQHEKQNIFMFDPTPIPDQWKKNMTTRLSHKFNLVFPLYKQAAQELQEPPFRSWEFWNTETLDKEMQTRNMYLILHTL
jgi:hypothetical protein